MKDCCVRSMTKCAKVIGLVAVVSVACCSFKFGRIIRRVGERMVTEQTVESRIADIQKKKPRLEELANRAQTDLTILVFKHEQRVDVQSKGWREVLSYPMTAFSGKLGPKLREGDLQIPEGIYGIDYLNPRSLFYLSLKVSYPNAFDRRKAGEEGRDNLGGDIMIHGEDATVGCVPIGNDAIEDVFYLVAKIGKAQTRVIVAPYDMRNGRKIELEQSDISWYKELCDQIFDALMTIPHGM